MAEFALRFLGVGNANARSLGSSAAVLERDGAPLLLIDCGPDTLHSYLARYGQLPPALFITHAHLDHVAGLEGLFYRLATTAPPPEPPRLFVPVTLVPVLQRRLADYPNLLAEGGRNFWDVFRLCPVSERFWPQDLVFDCFPARHHDWLSAFGLALAGRFVYSGDTRPIPEVINSYASQGEPIFHDCALSGNPSHTGLADIRAQYKEEQWRRMVFYHYESETAGEGIAQGGHRIAHPGESFRLGPGPGGKGSAQD